MGPVAAASHPDGTNNNASSANMSMHASGLSGTASAAQQQIAAAAAAANKNANVLPKCFCSWKNCRAYQKAWREAKHDVWDGVIKLNLVRDHPESMALKASIDRILAIPETKSKDWKSTAAPVGGATPGTSGGSSEHVKYVIARHHFTEKHILKYLQDPKNFSFLKPFSVHGAHKYLYAVSRTDTLATTASSNKNGGADGGKNSSADDADLLYLQCPNVPKEVVKEEFYRSMEKVKAFKKGHSTKQPSSTTAATTASTTATSSAPIQQQQQKKKTAAKAPTAADSANVALRNKEEENGILKDQLDAMKSQLTFLHDMVQKLQEQHFETHSVHTGRSSRYRTGGTGGVGASSSRRSGAPPNSGKAGRSVGVPHEIELGDEEGDTQSYWNEPTEGEWTDHESNRGYGDDDEDDDDDEQTTNTFQVTYRASRAGSGGCDASVVSKACSTIVSASKSVKTLPREIELDADEDDSESHASLEEEAFDNRSFASSLYGGRSRNGSGLHDSYGSTVDNGSRHSRRFSAERGTSIVSAQEDYKLGINNGQDKGPSAMKSNNRTSIGPNSKKPNRRSSIGENSQQRKQSLDTSSSDGDKGTHEVTSMVVTDPYGEKGSYTGSISSSTGMPNGYGRLEYDKAGRWYEGDWKHGRWTGKGQLSNGDGDFYEGGLKNDHKHGIGRMKFTDGRTFEGEYINGQMVEGLMTYQDGSTYCGSWVDGMRHGRGRCVFTDESIYEGEFKEGEFFGRGKMTWNDGGWYEGEWLNGDMHGRGREVRSDGSLRHDGEWLKGQPIRNKK